MRSIVKFLFVAIITITIPTLIMSIAYAMNLSEIGLVISQMFIILIFVLVFTFLLRYQRKYEIDSLKMIESTRDPAKLREIRDQRKTYKSKAIATSKILSLDYSQEEVQNLKKYATNPNDMEHYFSAKIDHANKEDREVLKSKRDAYMKRHGKKLYVYPDFNENLRTAGKWIAFYFVMALLYNIVPNFLKNEMAIASFIILGMVTLAVIMVMAILWVVRTLTSYWQRDMV